MYPSNQHQHQYDHSNLQHIDTRVHQQPQPILHAHPSGPVFRDSTQPTPTRLHPPPHPHHPSTNPSFITTPLSYDWRHYAPHPTQYIPRSALYSAYGVPLLGLGQPQHHQHPHAQLYSYSPIAPAYRPLPIPHDENTNPEPTSATTATGSISNGQSTATASILGSGPLKPLTTSAINSLMAHLGNTFPSPKEEGEDELSPISLPKGIDESDPDFLAGESGAAPDTDEFKDAGADADPEDGNYVPTTRKVARKVKTKAKAGKKGKAKAKGKGKAGSGGKKHAVSSPFTSSPFTTTPVGSNFNAVAGPSSLRHSAHPSVSSTVTHIHPAQHFSGEEDTFRNLKNVQYPLMPIPEGSFSDVNDLLILHPPSHSPAREAHKPINQYSGGDEPIPHAGQSKWEMYTCRSCRKTYDGKNARSVARRHLQDKHGIPLSKQARRTRWDHDVDRPKDAQDAHERGKKCKRDWAKVTRQQRQLERLHADYLLQFGPKGLTTSWRHPLIAPIFRDVNPPVIEPGVVFTKSDEVIIPPSLRESASVLRKFEIAVERDESLPFVSFEDLLSLDEGMESDCKVSPFKLETTTSTGSITTLPTSPLRPNFQPYTSTPVSSVRNSARSRNDSQHGPTQEVYDQEQSHVSQNATLDEDEIDLSIFDDPTERFYGLLAVDNQAELDTGIATDVDGEEDEGDGPPPLWVEPSWQTWRDFPSTSSADLAQLAVELANSCERAPLEATQQDDGTKTTNVEVEIDENAAADSLLNLQSSPTKPDSSLSRSDSTDEGTDANMPPPLAPQWSQQDWANSTNDFIADCSSRPTYQHGKSMSASIRQPFLHRPGNLQRSLSNATLLLDDPFEVDTAPRGNGQARSPGLGSPPFSQRSSKVRPRSSSYRPHPSPSPLLDRKRKPLAQKHSNLSIPNRPTSFEMLTRPSESTSRVDVDSNDMPIKQHGTGSYDTPIRPSRSNPPSSVGQWLQFSSPVDPAASLGLAPTHAVPTTPGLRMIIGQDTPDGSGMMSGKKRRGAATPQIR